MRLRLALLGILCAACGSAAPPVEHAWGRASPIAEPASLPAPTADPASADHLAELADEAARQIELGVEAARRDRDVVWLWCLVERRDEATAARDAIGAASASLAASDDPAAVLDAPVRDDRALDPPVDPAPHERLEHERLRLEAADVAHPHRPPHAPEDLKRSAWVMREAGSGTRAVCERAFADHGLSIEDIEVAFELPSNEAVRVAVESGAGAAILSTLVVAQAIKGGRLVAVTFDLPPRHFHVLRHKERHLSLAERRFLEFI